MEFLKKPLFSFNGFTLTLGLLIVVILVYWFFLRKRKK